MPSTCYSFLIHPATLDRTDGLKNLGGGSFDWKVLVSFSRFKSDKRETSPPSMNFFATLASVTLRHPVKLTRRPLCIEWSQGSVNMLLEMKSHKLHPTLFMEEAL